MKLFTSISIFFVSTSCFAGASIFALLAGVQDFRGVDYYKYEVTASRASVKATFDLINSDTQRSTAHFNQLGFNFLGPLDGLTPILGPTSYRIQISHASNEYPDSSQVGISGLNDIVAGTTTAVRLGAGIDFNFGGDFILSPTQPEYDNDSNRKNQFTGRSSIVPKLGIEGQVGESHRIGFELHSELLLNNASYTVSSSNSQTTTTESKGAVSQFKFTHLYTGETFQLDSQLALIDKLGTKYSDEYTSDFGSASTSEYHTSRLQFYQVSMKGIVPITESSRLAPALSYYQSTDRTQTDFGSFEYTGHAFAFSYIADL